MLPHALLSTQYIFMTIILFFTLIVSGLSFLIKLTISNLKNKYWLIANYPYYRFNFQYQQSNL